jgi:hypothetical protein
MKIVTPGGRSLEERLAVGQRSRMSRDHGAKVATYDGPEIATTSS